LRNANSPLLGESGVIKSFLRHRHDLAPQTRESYEGMLVRFARWLSQSGIEPTVTAINMDTVEQYLEARREVVKASSTRCDAIVLKSLGQYIGRRILKADSPVADLRLGANEDTNRRALTEAELRRLLFASKQGPQGNRNYAIVMVAAGCGLRLGELTALSVGDLLFDEGAMLIQGRTSKSKRTRKVTMPDETTAALDAYLYEDHPAPDDSTAPAFVGRLHTALRKNGIASLFRTLARESQIPELTAHVLRHTWATNYLIAGTGNLIQLTRDAGWTDKQNRMAMRYVHERPIAERRKTPSPFAVLGENVIPIQKHRRPHRKAV
jgi:site-specific recombinase XerD